jgi:hypothetical protein
MNTKILSVVVLAVIIAGGIYWWKSTEPQRMARPNPNFVASEVVLPNEDEVGQAAESTGASTTTANQVAPTLEEIEAAAKPQ